MINIIIILIIIIGIIYIIFRYLDKKEKLIDEINENKYSEYILLLKNNMYVKELEINGKAIMKKRKLTDEEIKKIIYYIFIPKNNEDKSIKYIIYEYLDFIQKEDIIPNEKKNEQISNNEIFIEILHKVTGKNKEVIENMKKKEFIDILKN
jgi:hypothetical protein